MLKTISYADFYSSHSINEWLEKSNKDKISVEIINIETIIGSSSWNTIYRVWHYNVK